MANSAAVGAAFLIILLLVGGFVAVTAFQSGILTSFMSSITSGIADFFKQLGLGLNITSPTPTGGGSPTPTGGGNPTPTPVAATYHLTLSVNSINSPAGLLCTVLWTDQTTGVSGAISLTDGSQSIAVKAGDSVRLDSITGGGFHFDHYVTDGFQSNTNPLIFSANKDSTVTAYFVQNTPQA